MVDEKSLPSRSTHNPTNLLNRVPHNTQSFFFKFIPSFAHPSNYATSGSDSTGYYRAHKITGYYNTNAQSLLLNYSPSYIGTVPLEEMPSDWEIWSDVGVRLSSDFELQIIRPSPPIPRGFTRKALRGKLANWFCDPHRRSNLFFIEDPDTFDDAERVTAAAQDTVSICQHANRLGAACKATMVTGVGNAILFVALQLAARCLPYRMIGARELMESSPSLFERSMEEQFDALIVRPWKQLAVSHPDYLEAPLVIILDLAQPDLLAQHYMPFLKCLNQYMSLLPSPLLFVVCTSPSLKESIDFESSWEHHRVCCWDSDARRDEETILRFALLSIPSDDLRNVVRTEVWPTEADISILMGAIGGITEFAGVVTAFITNLGIRFRTDSPQIRLNTVLRLIADSPLSTPANPLRGLDHFLLRFLAEIPPPALEDSILVISFAFLYLSDMTGGFPYYIIPLFLRIEQDGAYEIWDRVSWTVRGNADMVRRSFWDFLIDPWRSGDFHMVWKRSRSKILESAIATLSSSLYTPDSMGQFMYWGQSLPVIGNQRTLARHAQLILHLSINCFVSETRTTIRSGGLSHSIAKKLKDFDYRKIAYACLRVSLAKFATFLVSLYDAHDLFPDIVRTEAITPTDKLLVQKCSGVIPPLDMRDLIDLKWGSKETFGFILLGYGQKTVLVVLYDDIAASNDPIPKDGEPGMADHQTGAVTIYTLDMLDDL
ncbi:hypothetical protein NP233_g9685 [Leucocoprinus birnbaumii]|uniref:Uncharacterized protein n=1 Tax=Leucocoprinus birnbaumii TaxID=56174 RepID=A0AAD5YSM7_9AGAR|nr:hypothetical protein NP233_g9685 [Leucocoprinus birnbaumii]